MGCDIHMVLEQKTERYGWVGIDGYDYLDRRSIDANSGDNKDVYVWHRIRNRNYELFAELAGVRGPGPEPRGVPDDVSPLAQLRIDADGSDGHSHSWGLLSEIGSLFMAHCLPKAMLGPSRHDDLRGLFRAPEEVLLEDLRLVFWFDN